MISIKTLVFNPFSENTYILYDKTRECAIIDPGCYGSEEEKELVAFIDDHKLRPVLLLNTHCHIDHVLGNKFVRDYYNLPLQIPEHDKSTYDAVPTYASIYGFPDYQHIKEDRLIKENELLTFGEAELQAIFLPGHTKGHLAFIEEQSRVCLAGDVLFEGSIGRTDLPGGDFDTLIRSIQQTLFEFPDDMTVYPGHGPTTTLGQEKRHNPFCAVN